MSESEKAARIAQTSGSAAVVRRWMDLPEREKLRPGIDRVFFEAAGPRQFAADADRAAFHWRWLGQFLHHEPDLVHVALAPDGRVAGYLVGCLRDPAGSSRFADLSYFQDFAQLTALYPAHLHLNLAERDRGAGLGGRLVEAFAELAAAAGAPGVHVVTGEDARNVGFYTRNGFQQRGAMTWQGRRIVLLGRGIEPSARRAGP